MKVTIELPVDPTEAKTNLRFFTVALGAGITVSLLAGTLEHFERLWVLSSVLVLVVGIVSLMILGMAVFVARDPSLRRLTLVGLATIIAPWFLALLLVRVFRFASGHDAGGFSLMYYMLGCTIAGLGLLVTASVRFIRERRNRKLLMIDKRLRNGHSPD
jgi:hypothetical protein